MRHAIPGLFVAILVLAPLPAQTHQHGEPVTKPTSKPADDKSTEKTAAQKAEDEAKKKEALAAQKLAKTVAAHIKVKQVRRGPAQMLQAIADRRQKRHEQTQLEARIARATDKKEKAELEKKRFPKPQWLAMHLTIGDWQAVGKHIAELPEKARDPVFDHVLTILQPPTVRILPDEILPIAEAAPSPLNEKRMTLLGKLLAKSGRTVPTPAAVVDRIRRGAARFGGKEPAQRLLAARLFLAAGMPDEAFEFLPPLDSEQAKQDLEIVHMHAIYHETAGKRTPGPDDHDAQSFELSQKVLAMGQNEAELPKETKKAEAERTKRRKKANELHGKAIQRLVRLFPNVSEKARAGWLDSVFGTDSKHQERVLATVVRETEGVAMQPPWNARRDRLTVLHRAVSRVMQGDTKKRLRMDSLAELLTGYWLQESHYGLQVVPRVKKLEAGSPAWHAVTSVQTINAARKKVNQQPIPAKHLLELIPDATWIQSLRRDYAPRLHRLRGLLIAQSGDIERTLKFAEDQFGSDDELATECLEQFLTAWTNKQPQQNQYYGSYYYRNNAPITRARQLRKLKQLEEILEKLRSVELPLAQGKVVAAFTRIYSLAEVYRKEDLTMIFGEFESLSIGTAVRLASDMRQKLAGLWRQSDPQQTAGTKRNRKQIAAEVARGYELAIQLLSEALTKIPHAWQLHMHMGTLRFDQAEFSYGQKVDLATYSKQRDKSFGSLEEAAEAYGDVAESLPKEQQNVEPHRQWFYAALGTSDLAFLTRQDKPELTQLEKVKRSLQDLPAAVLDHHLQQFGASLDSAVSSIPAQLKPRFLRHGLSILGEHKSGEQSRKLLQLYDDLLGEVRLELLLDGDAIVGHGKVFGAGLFLRYSTALGRESDGFSVHLQNKVYNPAGGGEVNYRDELEQNIRKALGESFDIESVTFFDAAQSNKGYGRHSWRQTPLCYMVLKAKDAGIDRIPEIQMDLQFPDGQGHVLLPITSQVLLLDARPEKPAARPFTDVTVKQVLDARPAKKDSMVRLELTVASKGLPPELPALVDTSPPPGYRLARVSDNGTNVHKVEADGSKLIPHTERSFVLEYKAIPESVAALQFAFPSVRDTGWKVERKFFSDADIVDAGETVEVTGLPGFAGSKRYWAFGGVILLVLGLLTAWLLVRPKAGEALGVAKRYHLPADADPFRALTCLGQMSEDPQLRLSDTEREELKGAIRKLEQSYFARGSSDGVDVQALLKRWVDRAGVG